MMRYFGYGFPWVMGICGIIAAVFFILLIVLMVRALIWGPRHASCSTRRGESGDDEAMAILRRRYAAGEISKEDYEERLKTLKGA